MSHEIRTPLQSVIGYSEQMKQQHPHRQDIEAIHRSAEHLLQVVNEILDYSRITSGKFVLDKTVFDMQELIAEVAAIIKPQTEQKNLHLVLENDPSFKVPVKGDAFRLKQILLNLLGNSVKFTLKGEITLAVSAEITQNKACYYFAVKDTGIGIPLEQQQRVFDYFEQGNSALNRVRTGTGLGLSIVKSLVDMQGGTIALDSTPGKGSCFSFSITYDIATEQEQITHDVKKDTIKDFSGNVWLVDDDALILKLCAGIFTKYAIPHVCFSSSEALLAAADKKEKQPNPSLFFIDIRIAGMNGIMLYDELKKRGYTSQRFIALTAQALPEEGEAIREHGFDAILLKPFREADLINAVLNENMITKHDNYLLTSLEEEKSIRQQYAKETTTDLALLKQAIEIKNKDEITFLLHRLAGRTAQIGETKMGAVLRKLELDFRNREILPELYDSLNDAIGNIARLIKTMQT